MQPDRLATAQWYDPDEFAAANPFTNGRFWLGRSVTDGQPLGYTDDRHICLVSGTRSGKGTSTIIPNLCKWPGSLVVVDPKGENATVTAIRRGPGSDDCNGLGQAVYVLDPFRAAQVPDELRASFNPLDALNPEHPGCLDETGHLADALVIPNPKSNDPFWDQTARLLVKTLILHVLTSPEFDGRRNLLVVRSLLLRGDHEAIAQLKESGETELPPPVKYLWFRITRNQAFNGTLSGYGETILGMLERSPKTFESVLQVAGRNTEFLDSPAMAECVQSSSFQLSDLKTAARGVSLYLSLPQRYMGEHFRWLRMILTLVVSSMEATKGNPATGHPVLMCLDEFAGLKRMEIIESAVAQIAGYGVKLMFVLQSLEQLKSTYENNWETFLSNAGLKLFYGVEDHFTREYVSKLIGDTEILRTARTSSHSSGENTSNSRGESTSSGTSHSDTTGENWSSGENQGTSSGSGRATNSKAWALGLRDTAAIFRALTGDRQTSTSENWNRSSGTNKSSGGSLGSSLAISETESQNTSETYGSNTSDTEGQNESVHKRPLITPDEIGRFLGRVDDKSSPTYPGIGLALTAGHSPALIQRVNYFEDSEFADKYSPHPDHESNEIKWITRSVSLSSRASTLLAYTLLPKHVSIFLSDGEESNTRYDRTWLVKPGELISAGDAVARITKVTPPVDRVRRILSLKNYLSANKPSETFTDTDTSIIIHSPIAGRVKSVSTSLVGGNTWLGLDYGSHGLSMMKGDLTFQLEVKDGDARSNTSIFHEQLYSRCLGATLYTNRMFLASILEFAGLSGFLFVIYLIAIFLPPSTDTLGPFLENYPWVLWVWRTAMTICLVSVYRTWWADMIFKKRSVTKEVTDLNPIRSGEARGDENMFDIQTP